MNETTIDDEILARAEECSRKNGRVLNPDKKTLTAVIRRSLSPIRRRCERLGRIGNGSIM